MAKRVSKRKQEKVLSPTELRRKMLVERKQREEQRAVLGILVPVLVLLVAFLAYGAYAELWREPRAPIARVEGETINAGRFQERIGWERVQLINSLESLRSLALSTDPSFINNMAAQQRSGLAQSTVDQMIDEALIRQEAEARGISVTEREVRNHIISTTLASILLATPEPVDEEPMTPIDEELDAADDAAAEDAADDPAVDEAADDASSEEAEDEPADDPDASSEDDEAAEDAVAEAGDADEAADEGESSEQASEGDTMTGSADENGEETATEDDTVADETAEDEAAADEDAESEDAEDAEDETSSLPDKPTDPDEVSDEDFDNAIENYLAGQFTTAGITRDDYFEIQRQAVYREKLNRALGEEIETTAPQIELDYLLFRDKATADAAAAALDAGQSWNEVVEEYGAPAEDDTEEAGEDEASEDEASEDEATEDEATADDEAAADEADASTADEVSEGAVSEDELSEDEATADEADAIDETAEDEDADEPADEPDADAEAEDETSEDEDSMEADAEDETAADDEAADDEAADDEAADDEAADDEAADDEAADDETVDEDADEEEAEPTASPSPIPAPTAEPFAFETGERRWYSRQQALQRLGLNEATADTVMGLETDASSEAIQGSRGFYVFRAVDREEARQLEEGELDTLRSTAVDDWLEERRLTADIQRFAYEDKVPAEPDWFVNAYNQITGSSQAMPTLAMPEVVGTAVPAPVEQEAPAPAGGEDASGDG